MKAQLQVPKARTAPDRKIFPLRCQRLLQGVQVEPLPNLRSPPQSRGKDQNMIVLRSKPKIMGKAAWNIMQKRLHSRYLKLCKLRGPFLLPGAAKSSCQWLDGASGRGESMTQPMPPIVESPPWSCRPFPRDHCRTAHQILAKARSRHP